MTPIRLLLAAYACAFALHLVGSHFASCAEASLHAWKAMLYLPAFQLCCCRTYAIALFICTVCSREPPISGRSEATR